MEKNDLQQQLGRLAAMMKSPFDPDHPQVTWVSQLMKTRVGRYLVVHPFAALALMLFSVMAAVPVGLFLTFALVTFVMSTVAVVFFQVSVLFVAGVSLLCVLCGVAVFSLVTTVVIMAVYTFFSNVLHIDKKDGVEEEREEEREVKKE